MGRSQLLGRHKVLSGSERERLVTEIMEAVEYLKKNNLEIEFGKIHLLKKNNAIEILENMSNPKREYLIPLVTADLSNC